MNIVKKLFLYLKNKLIQMNFLYHTPKSPLNEQEQNDIKKYGLIHFTFSEKIENILENGVIPGKEYMYKNEENFCWFYINDPETYEKNLNIINNNIEIFYYILN